MKVTKGDQLKLLNELHIIILGTIIGTIIAGAFIFGWWMRGHIVYRKAQDLMKSGSFENFVGESAPTDEFDYQETKPPEPFTYGPGVTKEYEDEVASGARTEEELRE